MAVATSAPAPALDQGQRFASVRRLTETLASPLSPEDQTVQTMADVSPTKWHRAHTSWFFETFLLEPSFPGYRAFDPEYGYLFNSYYEAIGSRHPRAERGLLSRPGIAEIAAYRRHVDEAMAALIESLPLDPVPPAAGLVELGLHHEQQHQELLLMDIKHVLSRNPLQPGYQCPADGPRRDAQPSARPSRSNPSLGWLTHAGGLADVGAGAEGFAFDNERPRHVAHLEPFAIADRPVTCGDWLEFLADGGYERPECWLSDGWAAVRSGLIQAPLYWSDGHRGWELFTLRGPQPVDPAEPVCHVSYYEADAYAHWAGARLPTEVEWEAVLGPFVGGRDEIAYHPGPLTGDPPFVGAVWEWTASAYLPYPRFAPAPGAVG
ncbi:MAG TPA: ergothioneine biosynthesis protein EgtB, partial [Acidimicrobiales bacterium]